MKLQTYLKINDSFSMQMLSFIGISLAVGLERERTAFGNCSIPVVYWILWLERD